MFFNRGYLSTIHTLSTQIVYNICWAVFDFDEWRCVKWCNRDEEKANSVSQQQLAFHNPRACSIWWQMWSFLISRCYICLLHKCQMQIGKERRGREHEKVWHEPLALPSVCIRSRKCALSLHLITCRLLLGDMVFFGGAFNHIVQWNLNLCLIKIGWRFIHDQ